MAPVAHTSPAPGASQDTVHAELLGEVHPVADLLQRKLHNDEPISDRWLDVDEVRLTADLRVMHSKVDELYHVVTRLKQRHPESDIRKYANQVALENDIHEVDQIYLWFIGLKDANARLSLRVQAPNGRIANGAV